MNESYPLPRLLLILTGLHRPDDRIAEGAVVAGDAAGRDQRVPRTAGSVTHRPGSAERAGVTFVGAVYPFA